jgi:hypothetical protein
MLLVNLITTKKTKTLHCITCLVLVSLSGFVFAQDNSPYSRYGIGDLVPNQTITSRGMGGIVAGYSEVFSINSNNPASYFNFESSPQAKSKKISSGRALLDVGVNFETRSLQQHNPPANFTATNALFSYIKVGVPLRKYWGLSFGLRPVSRISYKIFHNERLYDPNTGLPIDSAITRYEGTGGSYLASIGTGLTIYKKETPTVSRNLSVGFNTGYFFGNKDYSSRRSLLNDTVDYFQGNSETKTSFGNIYVDLGMQYRTTIGKGYFLTVGAFGNWNQHVTARQDRIRETFIFDPSFGDIRLDSVSDERDIKGKMLIPAQFTAGLVLQKLPTLDKGSWLIGLDFMIQQWEKYRFYGQVDSLRNTWEIRAGGQYYPEPSKNYFSNIAYRFGFFVGPDYIKVGGNLPRFGVSLGFGLLVRKISPLNPYQRSMINLAFEYLKRGNSSNIVSENMFRFSLGFSLSDIWFIKRRYD